MEHAVSTQSYEALKRQTGNETNPWYCLDMENVILLQEKHIPPGELERNVACDLNNFSWFDRIDFRRPEKKYCYQGFCMGDEDVPYELYDSCGVPGEAAIK